MKRTVAREHIFRILFRYDFHDREEFDNQVSLYFEENALETDSTSDETLGEVTDLDEAELVGRIGQIVDTVSDLDSKISDKCEGWTIDRIGKAELSILRLAVYEIFYDEKIEPAVAINEAVELAKKYCDDKAPSFINGILAKIIK